jgi:protein-disulfide isomerase
MTRTIAHKRKQAHAGETRLIVLTLAGAAALLGVVLLLGNLFSAPSAAAPSVSSGRVWGLATAPINIEIYSDFQCPYCARADGMLHEIAPAYFDSGKARVTYHYFAFLGDESRWAANAAECAGRQGKFWEFSNILFTHQAGENAGAFTAGNLKRLAQGLDLAQPAFAACVDGNQYAPVVQQDTLEGQRRGVNSTPTFFVNGRMVQGIQSSAQFAAMLDTLPGK